MEGGKHYQREERTRYSNKRSRSKFEEEEEAQEEDDEHEEEEQLDLPNDDDEDKEEDKDGQIEAEVELVKCEEVVAQVPSDFLEESVEPLIKPEPAETIFSFYPTYQRVMDPTEISLQDLFQARGANWITFDAFTFLSPLIVSHWNDLFVQQVFVLLRACVSTNNISKWAIEGPMAIEALFVHMNQSNMFK
jgi:hypothetical protein